MLLLGRKKLLLIIISGIIFCPLLLSQNKTQILKETPSQSLFAHGVASGDPLSDRFIIWTRVTPLNKEDSIRVNYYVAEDSSFAQIVNQGQVVTDKSKDFTIKLDIKNLEAGKTYFYYFNVFNYNNLGNISSPIGRGRTTSSEDAQQLRFAVMSCSNYEDGYFHAYTHVARQNNLQAVIHLGDYIYESFYRHKWKTRNHFPPKTVRTLDEYRQRYAHYRLDTSLQEVHRLHPFITIWDDHEVSNDANTVGPARGGDNWAKRLANAKQAYFEWMPIRDHPDQQIYRSIPFGNLADLIMLDTRLEGRDPQIFDNASPQLADSNRSMLGDAQRTWLLRTLKDSKAQWRILGNQVIFSPLYTSHIHQRVEDRLLDMWDGYPAERLAVTQLLQKENIDNTIILTGDFHSSLVFEVPVDDWNYPRTKTGPTYHAATGKNAVAVEFAVPSITSQNFDEFVLHAVRSRSLGRLGARYLEGKFSKDKVRDKTVSGKRRTINPHLKWANLRWHGYVLLEIDEQKVTANYYHIKHPRKPKAMFKLGKSFEVFDGENALRRE